MNATSAPCARSPVRRWLMRRSGIDLAIAAFGLAMIALIWSAVVVQMRLEREEVIATAVRQNANLAIAVEENTIRTIKGVDAIALFLGHEYGRLGRRIDIAKYIEGGLIDARLFTAVIVLDERGDTAAGSHPAKPVYLGDRDFFQVHLQQDSGTLFIGKPLLGRISGKWTIPMSRRINKPDGGFAGVVSIGIDPGYFMRFYLQADIGERGLVTLTGLDGISRARRAGSVANSGQDMSNSRLHEEQARRPSGSFLSEGKLDGTARYISYRTLAEYPLIVAVGTAHDEVLAAFAQRKERSYWAALLTSAVIMLFAALLMLALARKRRTVAMLVGGEARLRATFNQAAIGIARLDMDGRYLEVNQRLCEIVGYSREELLALNVRDITCQEDVATSNNLREGLLRDTGLLNSLEREKRYLTKSGSVIWASVTLSLVRTESGEADYFLSMVQDISARKKSEERLLESEQVMRATFENAAIGIAHTAPNGRYLRVNAKFCALVGYAPAELLAMSFQDTNHADDLAIQGEARRKLIAGEVDEQSFERRLVRKDGTVLWTNRTMSLVRDAAGAPLYFIRVMEDITERRRMTEALRESEEGFRTLAESLPQLVWISRPDGSNVYTNRRWIDYTGLTALLSRGNGWQTAFHPDDQQRAQDAWRHATETGGEYDMGIRLRRADGSYRWTLVRGLPLRDAGGAISRWFGTCTDIDDQKRFETALRESERFARATIDALANHIAVLDESGQILAVNKAWREFTSANDMSPESVSEGSNYLDASEKAAARGNADAVAVGGLIRTVAAGERDAGTLEYSYNAREKRWFSLTITRFSDAGPVRLVVAHEDITERKRLQQNLQHLAHYDSLTQLPNRVLFYDRLRHAIDQSRRRKWIVDVMFIDIDRFKLVNDTLGHDAGDELLRLASARLAQCVRTDDTVGRLSGDEFAVILSDLGQVQDGALVAQKILDALAVPFELDGHEVSVTASIGIAAYPNDSGDAAALIKNADAAMYRAKQLGKNNYQFYTAGMNERTQEPLQIENDLRGALRYSRNRG